jgi:hypothetical protein
MAQSKGQGPATGEILFEFTRIGAQQRVSAIDPATGTEVVIVAPVTAPRSQVQQIAMAKLRRKLDADK